VAHPEREIISGMRRALYIDGFSFYYGVTRYWDKQKGLPGLGWCNFRALIERNFSESGQLQIKYFTAFPSVELPHHRPGESNRYLKWRRAVRTVEDLIVVDGFYKRDDNDGNLDMRKKARVEKQTDVNFAVEAIVDASGPVGSRPDHVFILSGDCDQMPTVFALQQRVQPPIPVSVLLPSDGNRRNWQETYDRTRRRLLRSHPCGTVRNARFRPIDVHVLTETMLATSLLPYALSDDEGNFDCPTYWKLPASYLDQLCPKKEWRPDLR
jgi:hypothetical protein